MALDYIQHETDGSSKKQRFIVLDDYYYEYITPRGNITASVQLDIQLTNTVHYFTIVNANSNYRVKIWKYNVTQSIDSEEMIGDIENNYSIAFLFYTFTSYTVQTEVSPVLFDTSNQIPTNVRTYHGTAHGLSGGTYKTISPPLILLSGSPTVSNRDLAGYLTQECLRDVNNYIVFKYFNTKPIVLNQNNALVLQMVDLETFIKYKIECLFEVEPI